VIPEKGTAVDDAHKHGDVARSIDAEEEEQGAPAREGRNPMRGEEEEEEDNIAQRKGNITHRRGIAT